MQPPMQQVVVNAPEAAEAAAPALEANTAALAEVMHFALSASLCTAPLHAK